MLERFEDLTAGVTQVYKNIQRIKKQRMNSLGLKGTQVMCIYYLSIHPEGMTAADLSRITVEDKASISRILAELEEEGYITYETEPGRKYRAPALLTEKGRETAVKIQQLILQATEAGGQGLTDEEREIFYRALFQIADNLSALQVTPDACKNLIVTGNTSKHGQPYSRLFAATHYLSTAFSNQPDH